jgi:hypothetical protein
MGFGGVTLNKQTQAIQAFVKSSPDLSSFSAPIDGAVYPFPFWLIINQIAVPINYDPVANVITVAS